MDPLAWQDRSIERKEERCVECRSNEIRHASRDPLVLEDLKEKGERDRGCLERGSLDDKRSIFTLARETGVNCYLEKNYKKKR